MAELIRNFDLRFALDEEDAKEIAALVRFIIVSLCANFIY